MSMRRLFTIRSSSSPGSPILRVMFVTISSLRPRTHFVNRGVQNASTGSTWLVRHEIRRHLVIIILKGRVCFSSILRPLWIRVLCHIWSSRHPLVVRTRGGWVVVVRAVDLQCTHGGKLLRKKCCTAFLRFPLPHAIGKWFYIQVFVVVVVVVVVVVQSRRWKDRGAPFPFPLGVPASVSIVNVALTPRVNTLTGLLYDNTSQM